ncbi:hypothetical protein K443DRAFT_110657, partial [Laccaria amethystina LaAM-08-1]
ADRLRLRLRPLSTKNPDQTGLLNTNKKVYQVDECCFKWMSRDKGHGSYKT